MVKLKKGDPLKVKRLPVKEKHIYYRVFSKLSTKSIITNNKIKNKINKAGDKALNKIKLLNSKNSKGFEKSSIFQNKLKKPALKDIIKVSKEFAVKSNLLRNTKVINLIKKIEKNNGNASMIMLGNAVYSDKPFKGSKRLRIVSRGACIL